jgi:hypothetical protein
MQLLELTPEQMKLVTEAVSARFMNNSVAYQAIPIEYVTKDTTQVRWNRYDYERQMVVDNETLTLCEPYSTIPFTRSQRDEASLNRGMTTIHRKTSELARFFDALAFVGIEETVKRKIADVEIPRIEKENFISLREAAMQVEKEQKRDAILVEPPNSQESLVSAAFEAVFRLEGYGYYSNYFSIWGERIWALLNKPEQSDSVRPKEILEDTIQDFYRSTTLPPDEALVVSLDGPTLKYVIAADMAESENTEGTPNQPGGDIVSFEPRIVEPDDRNEELYKFRVRFRAIPCVQETRSIIRIKLAQTASSSG